MKYGDIVIYFCTPDQKASNNTMAIAPAQVVIPWGHEGDEGKPTCNLKVNFDGQNQLVASSCPHAKSLEDAKQGFKWATIEECESWGMNMTIGHPFPKE